MQADFDISRKTYQNLTAKNSKAELLAEREAILAELGESSHAGAFAFAN